MLNARDQSAQREKNGANKRSDFSAFLITVTSVLASVNPKSARANCRAKFDPPLSENQKALHRSAGFSPSQTTWKRRRATIRQHSRGKSWRTLKTPGKKLHRESHLVKDFFSLPPFAAHRRTDTHTRTYLRTSVRSSIDSFWG